MKHLRKFVVVEKPKQCVHMVRHHATGIEPIAQQIKMLECLGNSSCHGWLRQETAARASIQLCLDLLAEELFEFLLFGKRKFPAGGPCGCDDVLPLKCVSSKNRAGERICQPEGDEVNGLVGFPMRKPAARADGDHG